MPITQTRMLALIEAAEDHARQYAALQEYAHKLTQKATNAQQAFNDLFSAIFVYAPTAQSQITIATERKHYDLTRGRNLRHAAQQRKKRQGAEVKETQEILEWAEAAGETDEQKALRINDATIQDLLTRENEDE